MSNDSMLLLLEFNEVNFDFVSKYADQGHLPNFKSLLGRHGFAETTSEIEYHKLEPWIQWVTAHTGLPFSEHQVFRLGDIVSSDFEQIWEQLARTGLRVGAISPMNAKCRMDNAAFFIPDPWTPTNIIADPVVKRLFAAIVQVVNDNARSRITLQSAVHLAIGSALIASPARYLRYVRYFSMARTRPWMKAVFLDQLLSDLFLKYTRKRKPNFATLFLNAAAHIQHHYMFSSAVYEGNMRNPGWYVREGFDPLLDVYQAYDRILGDVVQEFPRARLMLATGLHQDPHREVTYYWRVRDIDDFLNKTNVPFQTAETRMSRDFLVRCRSKAEAATAQQLLESAKTSDGTRLFEIDNRGTDLFAMLTYPFEISAATDFSMGDNRYSNLGQHVVFVAIKNGQHNGIGYFSDTGAVDLLTGSRFPLSDLPQRIASAFGVKLSTFAGSPRRECAEPIARKLPSQV